MMPEPATATDGERPATPHGALRAFLAEHATPDYTSRRQEAERLLPIAHAAGLTSVSAKSIAQGLYLLKRPAPRPKRGRKTAQLLVKEPNVLDLIDDLITKLPLIRAAVAQLQQDQAAARTLAVIRQALAKEIT